MYEQQSYQYPPVSMPEPAPLAEGDLFRHYEIKSWELSPRIYKILAISAILNIAAVLFAAQTSLLTRKGCDSPLVGSVCQVLDTVYVGSLLFGTPREWADVTYDRTKLGDDEDVTFIDVTNESKPLTYPEGYFQIANPEQQMDLALIDDGTVDDLAPGGFNSSSNIPGMPPGFPMNHPSQGNSLFDTQQHVPKQNPHVLDGGPLPGTSTGGTASNHNPIGRKNGRGGRIIQPNPAASPEASPEDTTAENKPPAKDPNADKKVDPTEPITEDQINKRPFVDLAKTINDLLDKNQVKLDSPIMIAATGKIDKKTNKFDPKTFIYQKTDSQDKMLIEVVKEAIEAMNDSGYLVYLTALSGKNLSIQILQDENNVGALIQSELENENKAKSISSGLNLIISGKKQAKEAATADQNDKDDLLLLQNAAVTAQGKKLVIGFNIPKADLQRMIQRKLADQRNQPKQPDGTTEAKPANTVG
jgi:hypothetical protein